MPVLLRGSTFSCFSIGEWSREISFSLKDHLHVTNGILRRNNVAIEFYAVNVNSFFSSFFEINDVFRATINFCYGVIRPAINFMAFDLQPVIFGFYAQQSVESVVDQPCGRCREPGIQIQPVAGVGNSEVNVSDTIGFHGASGIAAVFMGGQNAL